MGNISFIIPGKITSGDDKGALNMKGFNIKYIYKLIKEKFPNLNCELLDIGNGQLVISKNNQTVCEIWMQKGGCYLMAKDENIEEEENSKETKKWLRKLKALKLPVSPKCIGANYGASHLNTERSQVLTFVVKYFKGYWMDEGIHPEFTTYNEKYLVKHDIDKINEMNDKRKKGAISFSSAVPVDLQTLYEELHQRERYLNFEPNSKEKDGKLHENNLCILRVQQLILPYIGKNKLKKDKK